MPKQEIRSTAELEQCPGTVQILVGEVVREVRGTTKGRRNYSLEFSAMKTIADETGLDPTREENKESLTTERIEGMRDKVRTAVQASYDLTRKKGKKTATTEPTSATAPTTTPGPAGTPDAQPPAAAPEPVAEPTPTPDTQPPAPTEPQPSTPQEQEIFDAISPLKIVTNPELIALIKEAIEKTKSATGIPEEITRLTIKALAEAARAKATRLTIFANRLDPYKEAVIPSTIPIATTTQVAPTVPAATTVPIAKPAPAPSTPDLPLQDIFYKETKWTCRKLTAAGKFDEALKATREAQEKYPDDRRIGRLVAGLEILPSVLSNETLIDTMNYGDAFVVNFRLEDAGRFDLAIKCVKRMIETEQDPRRIPGHESRVQELKTLSVPASNPSPFHPVPEGIQIPAIPGTPEGVSQICYNLTESHKFEEALAFAQTALDSFPHDESITDQVLGLSTAMEILKNPTIIRTLEKRRLRTASYALQKAGEDQLALNCLLRLEKEPVSQKGKEINARRIGSLRKRLSEKNLGQPVSTPTTPSTPPPQNPPPQPNTPPPQNPPPQPDTIPEKPKSQAEIASETASKLIAYMEGLEQQSKKWKRAEGDSVLIIPEEKIEGLTEQLGKILETKELLYAEHVGQTDRTNLEGMMEKGNGLLRGIRSGQLKIRLLKQIPAELELIK